MNTKEECVPSPYRIISFDEPIPLSRQWYPYLSGDSITESPIIRRDIQVPVRGTNIIGDYEITVATAIVIGRGSVVLGVVSYPNYPILTLKTDELLVKYSPHISFPMEPFAQLTSIVISHQLHNNWPNGDGKSDLNLNRYPVSQKTIIQPPEISRLLAPGSDLSLVMPPEIQLKETIINMINGISPGKRQQMHDRGLVASPLVAIDFNALAKQRQQQHRQAA